MFNHFFWSQLLSLISSFFSPPCSTLLKFVITIYRQGFLIRKRKCSLIWVWAQKKPSVKPFFFLERWQQWIVKMKNKIKANTLKPKGQTLCQKSIKKYNFTNINKIWKYIQFCSLLEALNSLSNFLFKKYFTIFSHDYF